MMAKKTFSMDVLVDLMMTKLFLLAEYVCDKTYGCEMQPQTVEPVPSKDVKPTIRFSKEDIPRIKIEVVQGELFQ